MLFSLLVLFAASLVSAMTMLERAVVPPGKFGSFFIVGCSLSAVFD